MRLKAPPKWTPYVQSHKTSRRLYDGHSKSFRTTELPEKMTDKKPVKGPSTVYLYKYIFYSNASNQFRDIHYLGYLVLCEIIWISEIACSNERQKQVSKLILRRSAFIFTNTLKADSGCAAKFL